MTAKLSQLKRNIHLYPSAFTHESRILKEAETICTDRIFSDILLVGVKGQGLQAVEQVSDRITIYRIGPAKRKSAVGKAIWYIFWCLHALWFSLRHHPACVNCHSLPVLPVGALVKVLTGASLVYDAHELETETIGLAGIRKRLSQVVESLLIRYSELVIVVSPGIEQWYREKYNLNNVVTVLNSPKYVEGTKSNKLRECLSIDEAYDRILLYQGSLSPGRGVEYLLNAAPLLSKKKYAVVFMGNGVLVEKIRKVAESNVNVYFQPAVPPKDLIEYTASADVGVSMIEDVCLSYKLSLPNKLFEYLMARLPVLASSLPEVREIVEINQAGACIATWESSVVVEALERIQAMTGPTLKARLDLMARRYCWEQQERVLIKAYRDHVSRSSNDLRLST